LGNNQLSKTEQKKIKKQLPYTNFTRKYL